MIITSGFWKALTTTLLAASAALGAGTAAVADEGPSDLGDTPVLGSVVAPVEDNGVAGNTAQNVPNVVCHTSLPVLGEALLGDAETTGCTTALTQ
ncbi:hypothetical protein ACWFQ7_32650 [Streptomyces bacillaris]|uniref:Small secreted domain DUF320 n=1 Tax=Streptomyces cavourensis TaxID=67258 RepID=A0ABY5FJ56_9ACTN|nr:hypothetical protein [Streptomyces cavourensis]UTR83615.1 hypothetical protein NLU04_34445 [Streptomyces cavourensis]